MQKYCDLRVPAAFALALLTVFLCSGALAATRTVNSNADPGDGTCDPAGTGDGCTLREAIEGSLANDTVNFAASLNGAAIGLNGTEIGIARNLTIIGPSGGVVIDAGFLSRVFNVHAGTVTMSNLTIAAGRADGVDGVDATPPFNGSAQPGGDEYGGGIRNAGTLTLTNCRIIDNLVFGGRGGDGYDPNSNDSSLGRDGGVGRGGGIANLGTLTLINCTVSGNYAYGGAGGITYDADGVSTDTSGAGGFAYGGGIFSSQDGGTLIMTGCTLSGNVASGGPGADGAYWGFGGYGGSAIGGGLYSNAPTTTLKLCTLNANEVEGGPGGVKGPYKYAARLNDDGPGGSGYGGGIHTSSELTLLSCTLSDNLARGGLAGGATASDGSVEGGGLYGWGCTIRNTIIAGNSLDGYRPAGPDVKGYQSSEGHNFIGNTGDNGDGSVSSGWVASDLRGTPGSSLSPSLGPLQNNGGSTFTRALSSTSAALDAGDDAVLSAPFNLTTDQRGYARKIGAHVDIGAFEFGSSAFSLTISNIMRSGSNIVITCHGPPNRTFRLERKLSLTDANWQTIPGVDDVTSGGNGTATFTHSNAFAVSRAGYQVRLLP